MEVENIATGKWTHQEDDALKNAVDEHGSHSWKTISMYVPGRNHAQCLQRWNKVLKPGLVKGNWCQAEDNILRQQINLYGESNWMKVALGVPGRTTKQCRERWRNHLDPLINRSPFKDEEVLILETAYAELGHQWTQIAKLLPRRAEEDIKKKWKSLHPNQGNAKGRAGRPRGTPSNLSSIKTPTNSNSNNNTSTTPTNNNDVIYSNSSSTCSSIDYPELTGLNLDDLNNVAADLADCLPRTLGTSQSEVIEDSLIQDSIAELDAVLNNDLATTSPHFEVSNQVSHSLEPLNTLPAEKRQPKPFLTKKSKTEWNELSLEMLHDMLLSGSFRSMNLEDSDYNNSNQMEPNVEDDPIVSKVLGSFRLAQANGGGSSADMHSLIAELNKDETNHLMEKLHIPYD